MTVTWAGMSDADIEPVDDSPPHTDPPEALTSFILVRHGESVANANRLVGGPRSCRGLSGAGRDQVEALGRRLKATGEVSGAVLMSSHYRRAIETASIIGAATGIGEPLVDEGFGELDPGEECDGLSFDEFVRRYGRPEWPGDPTVAVFPGGETIADLYTRVASTLTRLVAEYPGRVIVVGTHGGVVDAAIRRAVGSPVAGGFDLWTANASLTGLTYMPWDHWRLDRYNDTAHLLDGFAP